MRFPRNSKIFRGQVDAAPFAGVFFLLLLFLLLFHTHVFIPGIRVDFGGRPPAPEVSERTLKVQRSGQIDFEGKDYTFGQLRTEMLERAQKGTLPARLIFASEPGTRDDFVEQVQQLIVGLGIALKLPGARLELPETTGFPGSDAEQVVIAINLNGQIFYHYQRVTENGLLTKLRGEVEIRKGRPLTMVVQADKMVPYGKIVKVCEIARQAAVADVVLASRPNQ